MNVQNFSILDVSDISYLENILTGADGLLKVVPFAAVRDIPQNDISQFCHTHGIYQIITRELVEFVQAQIGELRAIEIGAGNGCLGRALGIPLTDSKIQESAVMKRLYSQIGQPPVKYPPDIKKLEALMAVKVFKAEAAVGCWVTHQYKSHLPDGCFGGVNEAVLSKRLKKYIFVGNAVTHKNKELLRFCQPTEYRFDWLVSRSVIRDENVIWVFDL